MQETRLPPSLRPNSRQLWHNFLHLIPHCRRFFLRSVYLEFKCWPLVLLPQPILIESEQLVSRVHRHIRIRFRETIEPFGTRHDVELEASSRQAREDVRPRGQVRVENVVHQSGRWGRGDRGGSNDLRNGCRCLVHWEPGRFLNGV